MGSFKLLGYNESIHQNVSAFLIMKYGLFATLPIDLTVI